MTITIIGNKKFSYTKARCSKIIMADRSASEVVAKLRPIDDLMFSMIGRYRPEILEEFLRLILDDNSMEFIRSEIQAKLPSLPPYKSAIMDFCVSTEEGIFIDFEAQTSHFKDVNKRTRWYKCKCDSHSLLQGYDYSMLPDGIIVFFTEKDIYGHGKAVYEIDNNVRDTQDNFSDGLRTIFVNGEYKGNDLIGKYIHDFLCKDTGDMYLENIREAVEYFKLEEKGGHNIMCEIIEQYARDKAREMEIRKDAEIKKAVEKLEAENRMIGFNIFSDLVSKGMLSISQAASELGLSEEEFENRRCIHN